MIHKEKGYDGYNKSYVEGKSQYCLQGKYLFPFNFRPFCPSFKQTNLRQGKFKTIHKNSVKSKKSIMFLTVCGQIQDWAMPYANIEGRKVLGL